MRKVKTLISVNNNDYFSIEEAAQRLGIKTEAIRNYLYQGYFTTCKFKSLTLISARDIEEWEKRRQRK